MLSPAHARVLAAGTRDLPDHVAAEADPVLVEAARRLDPPRLRHALAHLLVVADPDRAEALAERRHQRRGLWLAPTWEGMVAVDGLLEAEAGHTLLGALEPLARSADAHDCRSGRQRTADALTELARRALEGGRLPQAGGVRPQLTVTVDLDSLLGHPAGLGGEVGWAGPLGPAGCRRLAGDGTLTRVLVTRHPNGHHRAGRSPDLGVGDRPTIPDPHALAGIQHQLAQATARLPPTLGGAPTQPLEVGRASRVIQRPSTPPWPCVTRAVSFPPATGPFPGATPTTSSIGWMAAPPTWPIWPWGAGPITGPSMRAAGGWAAAPTAG